MLKPIFYLSHEREIACYYYVADSLAEHKDEVSVAAIPKIETDPTTRVETVNSVRYNEGRRFVPHKRLHEMLIGINNRHQRGSTIH